MPGQPITLHVLTQHLDGGLLLAEPLLLDGVAVCHDDAAKVAADVERLAAEAAGRVGATDWHRIVLPAEPELGAVTVEVEPPKKQPAWTKPVSLTARYVRWRHGDDAVVGYFPALGIEVIADSPEAFDRAAPGHVLMALKRTGAGASLYRIAQLRRSGDLELSTAEAVVDLRTPKQRHAEQKDEDEQKKKPVIEHVGRVLTAEPLDEAYEVDGVVATLADALAGRTPTSVLLVGPAGVGKSAAFRELVRRRSELDLAATPFWGTSGARLVAGQTGFGMWQERCAQLCREAAKHRAVVHLGGLVELMEVGQSEMVSQGIATFLKPFVARGDLLAVAECTPEQLSVVERRDPGLLEVFRVVRVEEPSAETGRRIIARRAAALGKGGVTLSEPALATIDRLHRRYAGYSAFPARPLGFVRNLIDDRFAAHRADGVPPGRGEIGVADATAAFAKQTGLPAFLLDDAIPYDRAAARDRFAARVIGQPEAVDLVADLIATVKAGLSRPRRPIASLLFIGPTGVGKTEMAKTLAEFFFGSADRMARFDMSEFGTPVDVQRLVGGVFGSAGGAAGEGLLTARVREEPFSVLLLDEIEKAHPLLFDLLLQVLGEGRLTDAAGRVADFTNAVVVMTSNLGAEGFQRGSFGLGSVTGDSRAAGEPDARAHFTEAVREFLRPEMFNRIDRIVPFLPLDPATVERIVRRELDLVARRDGVFLRRVQFAPGDDVVGHLATRGYDRAYGARPLKRLIERELLVPLADGINAYGDDVRLRAEVGVVGDRLVVGVRAVAQNEVADGTTEAAAVAGWAEAAREASRLRRQAQRLHRSTAVLAARNELTSLREHQRRAEKEAARKKEPVKYDADQARRIARLETAEARAEAVLGGVTDLEERALLGVYERGGTATVADAAAVGASLVTVAAELDDLLLAVHGLRYAEPDKATVAVYCRRRHEMGELARAYAHLAEAMAKPTGQPIELRAWWFERKTVKRKDEEGKEYEFEILFPNPARSPYQLFVEPPAEAEGLMLAVVAPHAQARLSTEAGVHVFMVHKKEEWALVEVSELSPTKYPPSVFVVDHGEFPHVPKRRTYHLDRAVAKDERLARELRWGARGIAEAVEAGYDDAVAAVRQEVLSEAAAPTAKDGQFLDDEIPF